MNTELTMHEQILLKNVEVDDQSASLLTRMTVLSRTNPDDAYLIFKKINSTFSSVDLHFLCNSLQTSLYKKRDESDEYIQKTKEICLFDYELVKSGSSAIGYSITMPCIERLIAIYEKEQNYSAALEICQFALDKQITGNYSAKKASLWKKNNLNSTMPTIKQNKEKPDSEGFYPLEHQYIAQLKNSLKSIKGPVEVDYSKRSDGRMIVRIKGVLANHGYQVVIKNISNDDYQKLIENIPNQISEYLNQVEHFNKILKGK